MIPRYHIVLDEQSIQRNEIMLQAIQYFQSLGASLVLDTPEEYTTNSTFKNKDSILFINERGRIDGTSSISYLSNDLDNSTEIFFPFLLNIIQEDISL